MFSFSFKSVCLRLGIVYVQGVSVLGQKRMIRLAINLLQIGTFLQIDIGLTV